MKKFLLIAVLLVSMVAQAQVAVGSFNNRYAKKELKVSALMKDGKFYCIEIDCPIKGVGNGFIWVKQKDVDKFRNALIELQAKFDEWKKIAIENNVKDMDKEMPVKFPKVTYCWQLRDSYFATNSPCKFIFAKSDKTIFTCLSYKAVDDTNKYIDERFTLVFYSSEEIQSLVDLLSKEKIDSAIGNPANSDLFK